MDPMDPRASVDNYLTRIARQAWPNAIVTVHAQPNDAKHYQLEVPGEQPFVLGKVFGPARQMLRAIVFEHLPPEADRAAFTMDVRVIDDAKKPGSDELSRAVQIGVALRDESTSRTDAVLAGKLIALGAGGGAFTLEDIHSLRKHALARGRKRDEFEQLAQALERWCNLG